MDEPDDAELAAEFGPLLRQELTELEEVSEQTGADRAPVTLDQQSVGRLSRMDAMQMQAMAGATERRRAQRRARIEAALARIDEGEFGWCAKCGGFIGMGRLRADAASPLCVDCAE